MRYKIDILQEFTKFGNGFVELHYKGFIVKFELGEITSKVENLEGNIRISAEFIEIDFTKGVFRLAEGKTKDLENKIRELHKNYREV